MTGWQKRPFTMGGAVGIHVLETKLGRITLHLTHKTSDDSWSFVLEVFQRRVLAYTMNPGTTEDAAKRSAETSAREHLRGFLDELEGSLG